MTDFKGESEFDQWANHFEEFYPTGSRAEAEFRFSRTAVVTARLWTTFIDDTIRQATGQSRARWQTLSVLVFSEGPLATVELSHRMAVQWPTLVRILNELEADGLITREVNPDDRRSRMIAPTAAGRAVFAQVRQILDPTRAELLAGFEEDELRTAEAVLDRFFNLLVQRLERG